MKGEKIKGTIKDVAKRKPYLEAARMKADKIEDKVKTMEFYVAEREEDIETTEYDISTDDDSLRMIYSSTDQVTPQK